MTYETHGLAPALEQFAAVAEHEHVTRAAAALGVPQPTVSRSMARLSAELGVALFVPDGRGVRLTRQGRLLADHAERALLELRSGLAAVRTDADARQGRVVLGFLHSMGPSAVPRLLRGFRDAYPDVSVGLVQDSADSIAARIVEGRVDLGLSSPLPDDPRLRSRALLSQRLVGAVAEDHPLAARRRVDIATLAEHPLITMKPGYGVRTLTDRLLRGAGLPARYAFEGDELTTVAGLVSAGLGVAVLPAGAGADGSVELALAHATARRVIGLSWAASTDPTPPVAALRRHLITHGRDALVGS